MTRHTTLLFFVACLSLPGQTVAAELAGAAPPHVATFESRERAIACLAAAIAYESAHEPVEGQQAVAEVVLNRVNHPAYPKTVCGVVFAGSQRITGCQFSFTCNGAIGRPLPQRIMQAARGVAEAALDGNNPVRVMGATHYHANYVAPYWAPSLIRITKIGAHIFYRGAGTRDQGLLPTPFTPSGEPDIAQLSRIPATAPAAGAPRVAPATELARPFAPWGLPLPSSNGAQVR
jgi:spore germination cell wall hydrolase CwlJ-like protein